MRNLESLLIAMCRIIIGSAFWAPSRLLYTIKFNGLEYDTKAPRTYLAISHKRDLDPIVTLPTLLSHRGWHGWAGDIHFVLRDDAFSPGYLAHLLPYPHWFSRLLHPLSIGPVLRWLGAHPLEHLHIRPAEVWIRELLQIEGDMRVRDVLAPRFIQELATSEPGEEIEERLLSQVLSWRYHSVLQRYCGPEIFTGPARRRAERRVLEVVKAQLADLAAWLWSGGSLYGAPEGRLSPDGTLGPITAALHRLLHAGPPDIRILPLFISYDFMTARRPSIFVDLAPAIEDAPGLRPRELDTQLRQAWLRSARFTCTQLASGFLVQASRTRTLSFTVDDLARNVELQAKALAAAGRHVDHRLILSHEVHKLAAGFLTYAARHSLVRRIGHDTWMPVPNDAVINVGPGEVAYDQMPLTYAGNDLQEMLSLEREQYLAHPEERP